MNKRLFRRLAGFSLAICMLFTCTAVHAVSFDDLDTNGASAGASAALAAFFASRPDAAEAIVSALQPIVAINGENPTVSGANEADNGSEVLYDNILLGIVCTEGSLNIRESTTTLSTVVAQVFHGLEVYVIGEKLVNSNVWYKVRVMDVEGYALSNYIRFGEDAENYLTELAIQNGGANGMPQRIELGDISFLSEDVQNDLQGLVNEINYCLVNEYPNAEEKEDYTSMYAILVYLMEIYQHISEVSGENGLSNLLTRVNNDLILTEHARQMLSETTGQSDQDFLDQIVQAQEAAKAEAAYSLGASIANKAASYVGILPYVWGGCSLTYGADCSGFAAQIYAAFGLLDQGSANVHAYDSRTMRNIGTAVSIENIQPGDLICYNGHVAIYYGNGVMVHAPNPGRYVEYGNLYLMPIITIRRLY